MAHTSGMVQFHGAIFGVTLVATLRILIAPANAAPHCPPPPAPVKILDLPRYYTDRTGTKVDAKLRAQKEALSRPVVIFLRQLAANADKAIGRKTAKGRAAAAACALAWLTGWAQAGALAGPMGSRQGEYEKKWQLAGMALAYLKVKHYASGEQRRIINPWLIRLADEARAFFDNRKRRRNNHWYWLGLGLGAVALAADSSRHWTMARDIMRDAARDINNDGTLDFELARRKLALKYHAFSAMALVVLAELAASRGEDWYAYGNGALHRLVAATVKGLLDPDIFAELSGYEQHRPVNPGAGWLIMYVRHFPGRLGTGLPAMKQSHRWLGGRVSALSTVLQNRSGN